MALAETTTQWQKIFFRVTLTLRSFSGTTGAAHLLPTSSHYSPTHSEITITTTVTIMTVANVLVAIGLLHHYTDPAVQGT